MTMLLALALCLAPQSANAHAPAAPRGPLRALFTYDPLIYGLNVSGGRFSEFEIPTPDGSERFGLYIPSVPVLPASPLLVHFHAYNGGHTELLGLAKGMLEEADARGWFLVAPDQNVRNALGQANGITYGSDEAQRRVQAVLNWVLATFPIERDRVYGYGFSMGGGDCLSYAAQHLDPSHGAFAAVINHTGTLVLTEEWTRNTFARTPLENVFSGTPQQEPYAYRRASSVQFPWSATGPSTFTGAGRQPAQNLFFTPARSWFHTADTNSQSAEEFMLALDTLVLDHAIEYRPTLPPPPPPAPPIPDHAWVYLDPVAACTWFAQHTLVVPWSGTVHFARDARYHDLELTRKTGSDFGSLTFSLPPGSDTVSFSGVSNVLKVRIDAARSGLDTNAGAFSVNLGRDTHPNFSGRPVVFEVVNLGFVPTAVLQINSTAQPTMVTGNGVVTVLSTAIGTTVDNLVLWR